MKLVDYCSSLLQEPKRDVQPLLFRGQPKAAWKLKSTLERDTKRGQIPVREYYRVADQIRPKIESCTGEQWNIDIDQVDTWAKELRSPYMFSLPAPEYLTYLRHYGFPSPILDWTRSPHIAAYFAFNRIPCEVKTVAIYAYIEYIGIGKVIEGNGPIISTLPENDLFPERHSRQESAYTVCVAETQSGVVFSSHEEAFPLSCTDENLLWKFTLPSSERIRVLKKVDEMNINSHQLFNSTESLMETLALRVFDLQKTDL